MRGVILYPRLKLGLECFVHVEFCSACMQVNANNPEQVMRCTGFMMRYVGCIEDQLADTLMKPLNDPALFKLR